VGVRMGRTRIGGKVHSLRLSSRGHYDACVSTDGLEVNFGQVLFFALLIGITAWISFLIYRAMDHPRLVLHETPEGLRADPVDVVKYVLSMPILIALWWCFFFAVFLFGENHINVIQLFVFPSALILSIRALAFISPVTARELGKVLPVALVAFLILDGDLRSEAELTKMIDNASQVDSDYLVIPMVLFADYVFTVIWYWGWIRWGQPQWVAWQQERKAWSVEKVTHDDGGVAVLTDTDGADGRT